MSTRLARILQAANTDTNYEHAPTFTVPDTERLLRLLLTGLTGDTFYVEETTLAVEALQLFTDYAASDPQFLAQAIVYAREAGYLRTAPITALVCLSKANHPTAKRLFQRIAPRVLRTPEDLQDFAILIRQGKARGFGRGIRRATSDALAAMSEYHIIKYGAESRAMSLRDLYRLAHMKPSRYAALASLHAAEKAGYVVKGDIPPHLDQIRGYGQFKACAAMLRAGTGGITEADVLALLDEHRLPWEVATSQMPTNTALWAHLLRQMPIFALLRNLRNLLKYGVFADNAALEYATGILMDPERIATSKLFPFRFFAARRALLALPEVRSTHPLVLALETATDLAYRNLPDLGNRILVANDISGSMNGKVSEKSEMTMAEIAALGAAAIWKHAPSGDLVSFDTTAHPRHLDRATPTLQIAASISGAGGGTALYAPIQWAFDQTERVYDTAVFFTDSESWWGELRPHQTVQTHALELIRRYKARVNPHLTCVFVQLMPYPHAAVRLEEPGCYFVSGWNDAVLRGIDIVRNTTLLDTVRAVAID